MTSIPAQGRLAETGSQIGLQKHSGYNRILGTWAIVGARIVGTLALLALLAAWTATRRGGVFLGLTEQHLFNDAIVLTLFAILGLLDGIVHRQAP